MTTQRSGDGNKECSSFRTCSLVSFFNLSEVILLYKTLNNDYDKVHAGLSTKCKDLKLRSELSYEFVMNHLKYYSRCVMNMRADHNSLIHSVTVQLKTPKGLTSEIIRHQLAEYMAKEVVFFFPIMEEYLKKYCISYNTYIKVHEIRTKIITLRTIDEVLHPQ